MKSQKDRIIFIGLISCGKKGQQAEQERAARDALQADQELIDRHLIAMPREFELVVCRFNAVRLEPVPRPEWRFLLDNQITRGRRLEFVASTINAIESELRRRGTQAFSSVLGAMAVGLLLLYLLSTLPIFNVLIWMMAAAWGGGALLQSVLQQERETGPPDIPESEQPGNFTSSESDEYTEN